MKETMSSRVVPSFASEGEEAEWWYKHRQKMATDFADAGREGQLKRLTKEELHRRVEASKAKVVSIRLPEADLELARQQAALRGLPYQTYIKSLLHQALRRAE